MNPPLPPLAAVTPIKAQPLTFLSLFAGIGGLDLGLERAGMRCIGQVEIDPFCNKVLTKHWPDVPRHDDVRTFTKDTFNERPDVICGGFPCQDISLAKQGAEGLDGARSGLWREYFRIVREIGPEYVVVENVSALLGRGFGRVLADLASVRFDAEWECLQASSFGLYHDRDRLFCVAYRAGAIPGLFPEPRGQWRRQWQSRRLACVAATSNWPSQRFEGEPNVAPLVDGIPDRVGRHGTGKQLGNAVVPQVAEFIGNLIVQAHALAEGGAH